MNNPQKLHFQEERVIAGLINGERTEEIGQRLGVSAKRVINIMAVMRDDFNCKSTPQLIAVLFREGIIK